MFAAERCIPRRCRIVGATSTFAAGVRTTTPRLKSGPHASMVLVTVHGPMPPWFAPSPLAGPVGPFATRLESVPRTPKRLVADDHGKVKTMSALLSWPPRWTYSSENVPATLPSWGAAPLPDVKTTPHHACP